MEAAGQERRAAGGQQAGKMWQGQRVCSRRGLPQQGLTAVKASNNRLSW